MINSIFLENSLTNNPFAQNILKNFKHINPILIDNYQDYWGRVKKPYLQKRDDLSLFIAQKKGQLVKAAPAAYGTIGQAHYYFIHAYNCIYECQYCYLQGYFNTPDLVLFVNHEDIIEEIKLTLEKNLAIDPHNSIWFHAGEFSDSLALNHLTGELPLYFDFFSKNPKAILELRTKSTNIKPILSLEPTSNIILSFSLSPEEVSKSIDLKTPSLLHRLKAMQQLHEKGFQLAVHFDPIIYSPEFNNHYKILIDQLSQRVPLASLSYVSIGVARYTKDVYREVENNYPDSPLHKVPLYSSFNGMLRYSRPLRGWMLGNIQETLINNGLEKSKIYWCMES